MHDAVSLRAPLAHLPSLLELIDRVPLLLKPLDELAVHGLVHHPLPGEHPQALHAGIGDHRVAVLSVQPDDPVLACGQVGKLQVQDRVGLVQGVGEPEQSLLSVGASVQAGVVDLDALVGARVELRVGRRRGQAVSLVGVRDSRLLVPEAGVAGDVDVGDRGGRELCWGGFDGGRGLDGGGEEKQDW
jgi:hypothetical protein